VAVDADNRRKEAQRLLGFIIINKKKNANAFFVVAEAGTERSPLSLI